MSNFSYSKDLNGVADVFLRSPDLKLVGRSLARNRYASLLRQKMA